MKNLYLLQAKTLTPIKQILDEANAPVADIYEKALLPQAALFDENITISWIPFRNLMAIIERKYQVKDLGFILIDKIGNTHLEQYLIFIQKHSSNLLDALELFCDINTFTANNNDLWIETDKAGHWFCYNPIEYNNIGNNVIEQYILASMIEVIQYLTQSSWTPKFIGLTRSDHHYSSNKYLKNAQLAYGQPSTRILIDEQVKELMQTGSKPQATSIAINNFAASMVEQLTKILQPYLYEYLPSIDDAVKITGLSKRSLQRYLANEGMTYRKLIELIRFERSKSLLENSLLSVEMISKQLHYSNYHNFSRAFNRWAKMTPTKYRTPHL
ncbi:helix-turn-helix transcriptional regulator [Thalassotalea fonticola]|uniref:Helix-turn-helix transcriptional regulator n=1 Tax=Thalassotalea fonticola TaxID=3065649 RepID=A0ABZ0GSQ6_9GAMM|nr:helix-turn-helix transcriptional regulator [Colwelliaceae bacterium S1-1]